MHITTINKQNGLPGFYFYQNDHHFLFQTHHKILPHTTMLLINRLTGKTEQINHKQFHELLKNQEHQPRRPIWSIYGMLIIDGTPYLALITQSTRIPSRKINPVFCVKDVQFVSFQPSKVENEKDKQILEFIRTSLLIGNFYFSYEQNLTLSFKKRQLKKEMDSKYFWNQKPTQFLMNIGLSKPWIIPFIQGYIEIMREENFEYRMVSRRSKYMSGTRYNCRGLDANGEVSNFVQTEQQIMGQNLIFSHLTLRGSVPLFWRQQNGFSELKVSENDQRNIKGLKKHYQNLQCDYQCAINTINLLSTSKPNQDLLSKQFVKNLFKHNKNYYFDFDFNNRYAILNAEIDQFIKQYENHQSINNFQCFDYKNNKKINQQHFIPRVNCLDCVDRTNVICSRIGQNFYRNVMNILNINVGLVDNYLQNWVKLGHRISLLYCGTDSVADHITMKRQNNSWINFTSSIKSMNRFLNASLSDQFKQECNKYLLNDHQNSQTDYFLDNIAQNFIPVSKYSDFKQAALSIITWNVAGINTDQLTKKDFEQLQRSIFGIQKGNSPDILFITLQQIVELSTLNVITNENSDAKKAWQEVFQKILNQSGQGYIYKLYFTHALVGISSFVFVKSSRNPNKDFLNRIRKCFSYEVKRGMGGNLGNKGAIVSGFAIDDTIIIKCACHLAAHEDKHKQRADDIKAIFQSLYIDKKVHRLYKKCDFMFLTGDLNFRLTIPDQQIYKQLAIINQVTTQKQRQSKLKKLSETCQFFTFHRKQEYCIKFKEEQILFFPSFKYQKNKNMYDKKRKPAYCDRVLYFEGYPKTIRCLSYESVDNIKVSDHRAVIGKFKISVRHQNRDRKRELIDEYLNVGGVEIIQTPQIIIPKSRYNYE